MRGDVTDAGQPNDDKQLKIELLSQWKLEAESRKNSKDNDNEDKDGDNEGNEDNKINPPLPLFHKR